MSDKPGDFFLGVIDFFGIVVPGVALLILQGPSLAKLAGISVPQTRDWWEWVPALVAAYVGGHFLLGVGAPLNRLTAIVFPEAGDQYFQAVRQQVPLPENDRARRSPAAAWALMPASESTRHSVTVAGESLLQLWRLVKTVETR